MPNCFHLLRKSTPDADPVSLPEVDEEMCRHFGEPCDPCEWHGHWMHTIGLALACGRDWEWVRNSRRGSDDPFDLHQLEIIDWLEANFTVDAWAEVGK